MPYKHLKQLQQCKVVEFKQQLFGATPAKGFIKNYCNRITITKYVFTRICRENKQIKIYALFKESY